MYPNITDFYNLTFTSPHIVTNVTDLRNGTLRVDYSTIRSGNYTFNISCVGTNSSIRTYDFVVYPGINYLLFPLVIIC